MIEAYAIGVTLSLKGNLGSEIAGVARQFETLNRIIASSQTAVNELAAGMRGLARVGRSAAEAWQSVASSMERAARAASSASGSMSGTSGGSTVRGGRQSRALVPMAGGGFLMVPGPSGTFAGGPGSGSAGTALTVPGPSGTFAGGPGSGSAGTALTVPGGGSGRGGMPPLSVPPWAAGINNPRPGTHDFAMGAMGFGAAGSAMVGGVGDALRAEMEVREHLIMLRMNTQVGDAEIKHAREIGERITREVPGSTLAENMHHIVDLFTVMGDLNEALEGAPVFAKAAYLFKNMPGIHQGDTSFAAAQAVEVMQRHTVGGKINMEAFNREMSAMEQVAYGSRGRINGATYLGFAKQSRAGGMVANDQFLYRDLPAMLIALGGNRAGTGDAALWRQFVQGRMTQPAFDELRKAKLLDDKAEWSHGRVINIEKHLRNADEFGANRVQWMRDTILGPNGVLRGQGIDPNNKLAVERFFSKWASTAVGLGFMSEGVLGMSNIDKEAAKIGTTTRDPMSIMRNFQDPAQGVREFEAALNGLAIAFGKVALGPALNGLRSLTDALNAFSNFADKHDTIASFGVKAVAGLGALALGLSALSGAFLIAPGMWRLGSWLVLSTGLGQTAVAAAQFAGGTAAGMALKSLPGLLAAAAGGFIAFAARIAAVHFGVTAVDPHDRMGSWIDRHVPGAGAIDDWFGRHTPFGRTFEDQHKAAPDLYQPQGYHPPANSNLPPVTLINYTVVDGQTVAKSVSRHIVNGGSGPNSGMTGYDIRSTPAAAFQGTA